ncbi:MAG TPA: sulfatase-like hydrolase/transferase [Phycisphaerae bacterium]|nr:sulfatase-like hydrolase/transferase [Phycisphaerae bacterium]
MNISDAENLQDDSAGNNNDACSGKFMREFKNLMTSRRIMPLWVLAAESYAIFFIFRLLLFLFSLVAMKKVSVREIVHCFWVGLGFDSMVVGYIVLPLAVLLTISRAWIFERNWFHRLITCYLTLMTIYLLFIETVGFFYFLHYGQRINWIAPYYLLSPHEVFGYIFRVYPWAYLSFIMFPVLFYFLYTFFRNLFWGKSVPVLPGWRRPALVAAVLLLCIIACRGGFGNRPLNMATVYKDTHNQLLAELAKNHSYTLFYGTKNLIDDRNSDEKEMFGLMSHRYAAPVAVRMLYQADDQPLHDTANPLWRRTDTGRKRLDCNVVVIVMESMAGELIGALQYPNAKSCSPNLDRLCREGLFLSRLYAVGARTSRGMVGTLCGYPDLGWKTVLMRPNAIGHFLTLPTFFKKRGYETAFVYGGQMSFDNMGPFFGAGGVGKMIGQEQITATQPGSSWGWPDEFIFNKALTTFDDMAKRDKRFFGIILTVSNHPPFDVPDGRVKMLPLDDDANRIKNATRYADWALGRFFDEASRKPWFRDTIFVLVADTGREVAFDKTKIIDAVSFRVPCLFYSPANIKPQVLDTIASQTDIAPTLLSMLGGSFEHCFLGRNILEVPKNDGFALLREDDRMGFIYGDSLVIQPPRSRPILYNLDKFAVNEKYDPAGVETLGVLTRMHAIYGMAKYLYDKGIYNDPKLTANKRGNSNEKRKEH